MGSLIFLLLLILVAIAAPLVAPTHYNDQDYAHTWEGPSAQYLAGTDGLGRDVVSRLIYGARISLSVALVAQAIMLLIGVTFGLLAGWFGKWVDIIISRFVDIMFPFPHLLLIVMIMTYLKGSLMQETEGALGSVVALNRATGGLLGVFIAMGLTWWLPQCRLVRGMVLSLKERDFHHRGPGPRRFEPTYTAVPPSAQYHTTHNCCRHRGGPCCDHPGGWDQLPRAGC